MDNNPIFSIIIPTYNRATFIKKTIQSVLDQTFQNFEIIVVDDGSTDNTNEIVKQIESSQVTYYKKENGERAAARNYGAKMAAGTFVNFLDSDDILYSNHLQIAYDLVNENNEIQVFHLGYDIKDEHNNVLRSVNNTRAINRQILSGNILSCNGVFVKRECILQNTFNEDRLLSSLEDWELWIRLSARYTFAHSNSITSSVIQHDDRSVMDSDKTKIKEKVNRFVKYVSEDEINIEKFGTRLNKALASAWTYAALHLVVAHENKFEVLRYLVKGLRTYPLEIFKKRTLVIFKKLIVPRLKDNG